MMRSAHFNSRYNASTLPPSIAACRSLARVMPSPITASRSFMFAHSIFWSNVATESALRMMMCATRNSSRSSFMIVFMPPIPRGA